MSKAGGLCSRPTVLMVKDTGLNGSTHGAGHLVRLQSG